MNESTEKQAAFLGAYFDRDSVLRLSHWAEIVAWAALTIHLIAWLFSLLVFFSQFASGMFSGKGGGFLNALNMFSPYLLQPLPGVLYFLGLQAASKALLILLDIEDNLRRAARNK